MSKPAYRTTPKTKDVQQETRVEAYLIMDHDGRELTVIVTWDISEALRQAREEDVVREAVRRDGGLWIMPLRS